MDDTSQDHEIQRTRELAQLREWTIERTLEELESLDFYDSKFLARCEALGGELVSSLLGAMDRTTGFARLNAARLLLYLGEPRGNQGVIATIKGGGEKLLVRSALLVFMFGPGELARDGDSVSWRKKPLPIDQEAVLEAVTPLLSDPDPSEVELALEAILALDLPSAAEVATSLLKHPAAQVRVEAVRGLADRHRDDGALLAAETILFEPSVDRHVSYRALQALEVYCKGPDPDHVRRAASVLARYVVKWADTSDKSIASDLSMAITGLEAAAYSEESEILELLLRASPDNWRRGEALQRLAELQGEAGLGRLKAALGDESLRYHAAEGIRQQAEGRRDPDLITALLDASRNEKRRDVLTKIVEALIVLGETDKSVFEQFESALGPVDSMQVYWHLHELDPMEAIERLGAACSFPPLSPDDAARIERNYPDAQDPFGAIMDYLYSVGRLGGFTIDSNTTVDYVDVIEDLQAITGGVLSLEAVSQEVVASRDLIEIRYIYEGRPYHFSVSYRGDWYVPDDLLRGLNGTLEVAGKLERFIRIDVGEAHCYATFAPDETFRRIVANYRLPIAPA